MRSSNNDDRVPGRGDEAKINLVDTVFIVGEALDDSADERPRRLSME